MANYKKQKAFTLVELLVVIAIIGILATLAVIALQQARSRARDSKRVADVKQTQTALELFFNEQGRYPTVEEWNSGTLITSSGEMLMINIPTAPYPADGVCDPNQNTFYYQVDDDYSTYSISFCLGNDISNLEEGLKCATPGGILNDDCSGSETGGSESTACYPDCQAGYICQSGSCVVDTFECGQAVSYNGHTYPTVAIGDQCWFKENLRTDKFKNGESITLISGTWPSLSNIVVGLNDIFYGFYQNDSSLGDAYGYLYSGYANLDPRGLCPDGWKTPSRSEWLELVGLISPETGLKLNSCYMIDSPLGGSCSTDIHPRWNSSSYYSDDSFNFSALPGGYVNGGNPSYSSGLGTQSHFWTITPYSSDRIYHVYSHALNSTGFMAESNMYDWRNGGRYIRCIKERPIDGKTIPIVSTDTISNITANQVTLSGSISSDGGLPVYSKGLVLSEDPNPFVGSSGSKVTNVSPGVAPFTTTIKGLSPGKTYYIRAYAANELGIAYGDVLEFDSLDPCEGESYVDYNGHSYEILGMDTNCWFLENLRTEKFNNGEDIKRLTTYPGWRALSYYISTDFVNNSALGSYSNDVNLENAYGLLYSGHAIFDPRGLCPEGWRLPTRSEWVSLVNSISPDTGLNLHSCRKIGSPLGGSCLTDIHPRWNSSSFYGDNKYNFNVLPGGYIYGGTNANFTGLGAYANYWTSEYLISDTTYGRVYYVNFHESNSTGFNHQDNTYSFRNAGLSVRCIK